MRVVDVMLRIAICDDEELFLEDLSGAVQRILDRRGQACQLDTFTSGEPLLQAVLADGAGFDLILLDILMEGPSGIELARKIRESDRKVPIVFVTASRDYALDGYSVKAMHYLLKPVQEEPLEGILAEVSQRDWQDRVLTLRNKEAMHRVRLDTIEYLEYSGRRTMVHTGEGNVSAAVTLAQVESQLPQDVFIRCHQGYILNLEKVHELRRTEAVTASGFLVPISRGYAKAVQSAFLRQMQGGW